MQKLVKDEELQEKKRPMNINNEVETLDETETKTRLAPQYKVLIHNDDINSMDHVIASLHEVFKFEFEECFKITMEAHNNNLALCKVEPMEHAELHCEQLQSFSLTATIEPE